MNELSKEELKNQMVSCAYLETSDNQKATKIVRDILNKTAMKKGDCLTFKASRMECKIVSDYLLQEDVSIYQFRQEESNLEDYYMSLIGVE